MSVAGSRSEPWLTIRHLWVVITVAAAFIGPASSPIGPDIWWALLRGDWMANHGRLLGFDPFTSAPHVDGPILNVQWLADLFFHGLDALGGLPMVITGTAGVIAATYALVLGAAVTASGHLRLSCVAVWIAYALGASNLSPRPQTLAYPIFALFVFALMRSEWRKDTRLLWLLPPATAVWANVHGSFFTGFLLLGCAAAGRVLETRSLWAARPYAVTLAACLAGSLVNPYGPGALVYIATIGSNQVIRDFVTEWTPTTITSSEGIMFFGSLVLLAALMFRARLRLTAIEMILLLVFAYLAWSSVRAVVWWGVLLAPILARIAGDALPNRQSASRDLPLLNAIIIAGVVMVAVIALPWNKASIPLLPPDKRGVLTDDTPVGVAAYLNAHDPPAVGRMLNHQPWGGYLEWATWPRHQVFLDGRIELHPNQVWFDYLDMVFPSAHWRALVAQYEVRYMVLSKAEDGDLIADLRGEPGWRLGYEDDLATVFWASEGP
ncbi:MAG TPA: hypothetical protein VGQ62_10605 [Chloroflexota bacterium]|nr:hypothetical protein [Chloroflexota bacterium]